MTTQPTVAVVEVVPVAGHDEVPCGEAIRSTIAEAGRLLAGKPVVQFRSLLRSVAATFADRDAGGRRDTILMSSLLALPASLLVALLLG